MSRYEAAPAKMITEIAAYAVISYMLYVYLGPATALLYGVAAIGVVSFGGPRIDAQFTRIAKEGMSMVSTSIALTYILTCGFMIIIGFFTVVAAINVHAG